MELVNLIAGYLLTLVAGIGFGYYWASVDFLKIIESWKQTCEDWEKLYREKE